MIKILVLFFLILFGFVQVNGSLVPSKYEMQKEQCTKIVNILINVININTEIQNGTVNIGIVNYSSQLDINCILESLLRSDIRVVLFSLTLRKYRQKILDFEYFLFLDDFIFNVCINFDEN